MVQPPQSPELQAPGAPTLYVVCASSWNSWALIAVGTFMDAFTPRLMACEDWLWLHLGNCCVDTEPKEQDFLQWGYGAWGAQPLSVSFVEVFGWCSGVVWSWPPGVLSFEPPSRCRLTKVSCYPFPTWGQPVWATKKPADGCYLCWAWRCLTLAKLWTQAGCPQCQSWSHL